MKEVIESLSEVGFLEIKDFKSTISDKQISAETIIGKFKERKEVPADVLEAINKIEDPIEKKKAAVHILRISIYAKSIPSVQGNIKKWFETGKVTDMQNGTKIAVTSIKTAAASFMKSTTNKSKISDRADELQRKEGTLTRLQQLSLDKADAKAKALEFQVKDDLQQFLQALDLIYMSLASERK